MTGDLGKTRPRMLDQIYLLTCRPLDEMLNFVNSSGGFFDNFSMSFACNITGASRDEMVCEIGKADPIIQAFYHTNRSKKKL